MVNCGCEMIGRDDWGVDWEVIGEMIGELIGQLIGELFYLGGVLILVSVTVSW